MTARVTNSMQTARPEGPSVVRASASTRTEHSRLQDAQVFREACKRSGLSNPVIAGRLGEDGEAVSDTIVRDMQAGTRPLRLRSCPVAVQRLFHQIRLEELDATGPTSTATVPAMVMLVHAAVGDLSRSTHEAMLDGVIEDHELEKISKHAHRVVEVTRPIEMAPVSMRPRLPGSGK